MNKEQEVKNLIQYLANHETHRGTIYSNTPDAYTLREIYACHDFAPLINGNITIIANFNDKIADYSSWSMYGPRYAINGRIIWNEFIQDVHHILLDKAKKSVAQDIKVEEDKRRMEIEQCKINRRIDSIIKNEK